MEAIFNDFEKNPQWIQSSMHIEGAFATFMILYFKGLDNGIKVHSLKIGVIPPLSSIDLVYTMYWKTLNLQMSMKSN
jgi:hypothetical protein